MYSHNDKTINNDTYKFYIKHQTFNKCLWNLTENVEI